MDGPGAGENAPSSDGWAVVRRIEARLTHVEQELQALQDSIHRESHRRDEELAELRRQLRPEEIARTMSDDARRRGI
jgi:hypothetical protein